MTSFEKDGIMAIPYKSQARPSQAFLIVELLRCVKGWVFSLKISILTDLYHCYDLY